MRMRMSEEQQQALEDDWNAQADKYNQWCMLSVEEHELIEFGCQTALPQWISVDKRLPELHERVLGLLNGEIIFAVRDTEGIFDEWGVVELGGEEAISHWMPLPTTPDSRERM